MLSPLSTIHFDGHIIVLLSVIIIVLVGHNVDFHSVHIFAAFC